MADSDEEEDVEIKDIPNILAKIPAQYHKTNLNPRALIVDLLRGGDVKKELAKIEEYCKRMDVAMNSIVNGMIQPPLTT